MLLTKLAILSRLRRMIHVSRALWLALALVVARRASQASSHSTRGNVDAKGRLHCRSAKPRINFLGKAIQKLSR
jgi:hypothetical protein